MEAQNHKPTYDEIAEHYQTTFLETALISFGKENAMKNYRLLLIALSTLTLVACASQSGSSYSRSQTRGEQTVRLGVVESVRNVTIEGTQSGVGAATGAVVGGLGGSNVGGGKGSWWCRTRCSHRWRGG